MSGHSKWKNIKQRKGAVDKKRAQSFGKLLRAVSLAAQDGADVKSNMRLRNAIDKAREAQVPQDTVDRAIRRATEHGPFEELVLEAYGPGGAALLIVAVTDNRNRTIPEIKKILADNGGKWAEPGSVHWAFSHAPDNDPEWTALFPCAISDADNELLDRLTDALEAHDDVETVYTNAQERP